MYTRVGIKDSIWSSLLCWSTSLSHDMSLLSSLIIRTNWAILTPCTGNSVHSTSALWDSTDRSDTFHEESSVTANVEMRWKETPLDTCASYTIEKKPVADLVQLCLEMSLPGSYQYQDVFKMLDHRAAAWPSGQRIGLTLPRESLEGCPGLEYRSDIWLQGLFYVVSSSSLSLFFHYVFCLCLLHFKIFNFFNSFSFFFVHSSYFTFALLNFFCNFNSDWGKKNVIPHLFFKKIPK